MNWKLLTSLSFLIPFGLAAGQIAPVRNDAMGAHLNFGRGCATCHQTHSGTAARGVDAPGSPAPGVTALWGEDVTGFFIQTTRPAGEPADADQQRETPDVSGVVACLSCHDGNYASQAMMQDEIYEKMPPRFDAHGIIPTWYPAPVGLDPALLMGAHPVGLSAVMRCGDSDSWDCSQSEGVIVMKGAKSSQFVKDYGFFVKPAEYNNTAVVVCTTCHEPHRMNVFSVGPGSRSGLPPGTYATMFFLRGPYNRVSGNPRNDTAAQFCRQCHAAQANETYGANIPTVF